MPSVIAAETIGRAPGPLSFDGSSGSCAAIGVSATGAPPCCDRIWAVVVNAPWGTAPAGRRTTVSLLASSLAP